MIEKNFNLDIVTIPGPSKTTLLNGVNIQGGIKFVEIQRELFQLQNPTTNIRWNLGILSGQLDSKQLEAVDKSTRIFSYELNQLNVKYKNQPSSQHGALLNNVIRDINEDHFSHLLIIDPDFYVFSDNWIHNLIAHMNRENLSIIGASYPEIDARSYFDFPTAYFSLIDTSKFPLHSLDYLPDENQFELNEELPWKYAFASNIGNYSESKFRSLLFNRKISILTSFFKWRNGNNVLRDTGWIIRKKFKRSIRHEEFLFLDEKDLKMLQNYRHTNQKLRKGVDVEWYRDYYDDVKRSNLDPVYHYHKYGKFEGRIPKVKPGSRVLELRPHLKNIILVRLEKFYNNEFSIDYRRKYSSNDFLQDYKTRLESFKSVPSGVAYYFFFKGFFGMHFGHYAKQVDPDVIKRKIFDFYFRFRSV